MAIRNRFLVFYFLCKLLIFSISSKENNNKRKLQTHQNIILKVLEEGEQEIISSKFEKKPIIVEYINEYSELTSLQINNNKINIPSKNGQIILKWNDLLENLNQMFYNLTNIVEIDFSNFDTSKVGYMISMFENCTNLKTINFRENFITTAVKSMEKMFANCLSLVSLDLSKFCTSKVTSMSSLFSHCESLIYLDISEFITSLVSNFDYTFAFCYSLISLDIRKFNTSSATTFDNMFYRCYKLESLDFSGFDTKNVTTFNYMFKDCRTLKILDLSYFDTSKVKDFSDIFSGCISLTSLNVSSFKTSKATKMNKMFKNCRSLTQLDITNFDTSKAKKLESFFEGCSLLTSIDVSHFDTSSCSTMESMFYGCEVLTSLDVSSFDTSKVTSMAKMFSNCTTLTTLDLSKFNTSIVRTMERMFEFSNKLVELDLYNFRTDNLLDMNSIFHNCSSLTYLNISNFDTKLVTTMELAFCNCTSLTSLDISHFNTSSVINMNNMFCFCALESLDLSNFITKSVKNMSSMFVSCTSLKSLDLSSFNTEQVKTMESMFEDCSSLTSLNLSNFNITSVTNMDSMFEECTNLEYINIENVKEDNNISVNDILKGVREDIAFCIRDKELNKKLFNEFEEKICEYLDCEENWKENLIAKNIRYINGNCNKGEEEEAKEEEKDIKEEIDGKDEKEEDDEKEDFFKYNKDGIFIYTYEVENVDEYIKKYTNLTFIEIPEEEKKKLVVFFGLEENETLYIEIIDRLNNDSKTATSDYEFKIFLNNGTELNLSIIKNDININVYVPIRNLTKANFDYALQFAKEGYDIYDKFSEFYVDPCTAAYIHRNDIPLKDRKKDIYPNVTICEGGNCHYKSVSLEDHRIACECNMNADTLNETEDDYIEDDENVGNYILDNINYEIIRCYYLLLDFKNLKANPAFYTIVIIFILVVFFFIKFFCFGMKRLKGLLSSRNIEEMKIIGFYHECHHKKKNKSNPSKKGVIIKKKNKFYKTESNIKPINNNKKIKNFDSRRIRITKGDSSIQTQSKNSLIFQADSFPKTRAKKNKLKPNEFFEKNKFIEKKSVQKSYSINKSLKMDKLVLNINDRIDEYMMSSYENMIISRKKSFCSLFYYLLFYKIDTLHLFDKNRFFVDLCVGHILTSFVLIFFFDAFFYSDEIVSHKYHNNGKLDFGVTIGLGFISIFLTLIIIKYLKRGIVFKRRAREVLKIKNEKEYQKKLKEFFTSLYIQITIAFIIELLIISWGYYYIVIFFIIYYQSRKSVFINFLITLLIKIIITLIYILVLLLIRMISICSKISCLYNTIKFIYEIF